MTWVSLVCLLALSSSALGHYGADYRARILADRPVPLTSSYGSSQQLQGGASSVFDQTLTGQQQQQRPFLASLALNTQGQGQTGYGQQTQNVDLTSGSSLGIQQDMQPQQLQQVIPTQSQGYSSSFGSQQQQQIPQQFVQQQPKRLQNDQSFSSYSSVLPQQRRMPQLDMLRGYGNQQRQFFDQQQQQQQPWEQQQQIIPTQADIICQGQRPETVIPLEEGRKFVVCLDDGKGAEQSCPKGLHYHVDSRRCERKLGALENPCASQPCLNGGQCVPTDVTSYECQCPQGFDGKTCELDARICQMQQPCGQTPDSRCQSFRLGAALQHVCLCQQEAAYGLNCQQAQPNPCQGVDGPQPLAFSDKGFIMCDGERMFVESCPGGTVWDDLNKACVWPDMQGVIAGAQQNDQSVQGYSSYNQQQQQQIPQQRSMNIQTGLRSNVQRPQFDQSKMSTYSQRLPQRDQSSVSQYSQRLPQLDQSQFSSFTPRLQDQSMTSTYNQRPQQFDQSLVSAYSQRPQFDQTIVQPQQQSFQKPQQQFQGFQQTSSFGAQQQQPQIQRSLVSQQAIPRQQQDLVQTQPQQSATY